MSLEVVSSGVLPLGTLPLEDALLVVVLGGVTLYAIFGGADFGAGIWQALLTGRSAAKERAALRDAIGPVWEANHVWLIFVVVLVQSAFPPVAAGVARALWLPLLFALAGIVARGAGLALRTHLTEGGRTSRGLDGVFVAASVAAPFFLGVAIGAVAEGRLAVQASGEFEGSVFDWVRPFPIYAGLWAVGLCAYLAAVFLARERVLAEGTEPWAASSEQQARTRTWRSRAVVASIVVGVASLLALPLAATTSPDLWAGLTTRGLPFVLGSVVGGLGSAVAIWRRYPTIAAAFAAIAVAAVLGGAFAARHPRMLNDEVTVLSARAPEAVLRATALAVAVGAAIVGPSLALLLRVFKSARAVRTFGRAAALGQSPPDATSDPSATNRGYEPGR